MGLKKRQGVSGKGFPLRESGQLIESPMPPFSKGVSEKQDNLKVPFETGRAAKGIRRFNK